MVQQGADKPLWGTRTKVVIFVIFLALAFWAIAHENDAPAVGKTGISQGAAWHACKEGVREELRNPSTADFSILSTKINETGDGYNISGSLSAENDYGVPDDIAFSCDVADGGSVSVEVAN